MQSAKPQITVFIPTYNRLSLLQRAVFSVFECGAPVHLLVLDNCSSDGTGQWLEEISAESPIPVRITRHSENIGAVANYNAGFESVRTPFLLPLADDDELVPGFLSKAIDLAFQYPDVVAVIGARALKKGGVWHADWDSRRSCGLVSPQTNISEFLRYGHYITWSSILWRTETIHSKDLFQRSVKYGLPSDVYFQFSAFKTGPVYVDPLPAATFNETPGQAASTIGLSAESIRDLGALADSLYREIIQDKLIVSEHEAQALLSETVRRWARSIKANLEAAISSGYTINKSKVLGQYMIDIFPYCGFENLPFSSEIMALNQTSSIKTKKPPRLKSIILELMPNKLRELVQRRNQKIIEPASTIEQTCIESHFIDRFPPGHYYSPLPKWPQEQIGALNKSSIKGIDLQIDSQLIRLHHFACYAEDLPESWDTSSYPSDLRYNFNNGLFTYGDAVVYYCILRDLNPKRVVEIGSGWSSALLLDVNNVFFNHTVSATFIDPDTSRLDPLLRSEDRVTIIKAEVQTQPLTIFKALEKGDILFVDSSHVGKYGSDLLFIIFKILPELAPGVIVHFHDIPWPFEYPKVWFEDGRAWNEAYILRALLQDNSTWRIYFFNSLIESLFPIEYDAALPIAMKRPASPLTIGNSSLWIEKNE